MSTMPVSRRHIIDACNVIADDAESLRLHPLNRFNDRPRITYIGVCAAFDRTVSRRLRNDWDKNYERVTDYLIALGGKEDFDGYFWERSIAGHEERMALLAFMLAWHDDITGRP